MAYMFGTSAYVNPYYVESTSGRGIDYSQPQVVVEQTVTTDINVSREQHVVEEAQVFAFGGEILQRSATTNAGSRPLRSSHHRPCGVRS